MDRKLIENYIVRHGVKFERSRKWEELPAIEQKGILYETTASGYSNWFYIDQNLYIWWVYIDSSDGGLWFSEGTVVAGYRIPFKKDFADYLMNQARLIQKLS